MYIPCAAEHRHWLVMRHSSRCSLLQVLCRHGLGRTPRRSIPKADLQLLLSSTSACHWWEMAAAGKHEASDPFGLFSSSMLPAAQSLIFWSRTRGSAAAWLAPFPNSQTGSCPASQQLVPRPGGGPGQPGSEALLPAAAAAAAECGAPADFAELHCKTWRCSDRASEYGHWSNMYSDGLHTILNIIGECISSRQETLSRAQQTFFLQY